jgi:hypothetical protein
MDYSVNGSENKKIHENFTFRRMDYSVYRRENEKCTKVLHSSECVIRTDSLTLVSSVGDIIIYRGA